MFCTLAIFSAMLQPSRVAARCPNLCSGHGDCDEYLRCSCWAGWSGGDCSERLCPRGLAWADEARGVDSAHFEAECSNRGTCDRIDGVCQCMDGFTGNACQRRECESDCNGHGSCMSMKTLSENFYDENSLRFEYTTVWDAAKMYGCACDYPYTGFDCGLVDCPTGDDPLTPGQTNEVQIFKCEATGGTFVFYYEGKATGTIKWNMRDTEVKAQIERHPLIKEVDVTFSTGSTVCQTSSINIVRVEFTQDFGSLSPLVPGIEGLDDGGSVLVSADGVTTIADSQGVTSSSVKGTKETNYCSDRGLCDTTTGVCACYDTNGDSYASSDGYGSAGTRGDCGYALTSTTTCPGEPQCSGHGLCDSSTFKCMCSTGWMGGDCSQRGCPSGLSWFSYPSQDQTAHDDYEECSNAGTCDRSTGLCECGLSFYGRSCEYLACGGGIDNACTGHGRCMSMAELALHANDNGDATEFTYGTDPNLAKTWDAHRINGCLCDAGYEGYDCSLRTCPLGDDPATYGQYNELQVVRCEAAGGSLRIGFRQAMTRPIPFNATRAAVERELESLPTITDIEVAFTGVDDRLCYSSGNGETCNVGQIQFVTEHGDVPDLVFDTSLLADITGDAGTGIVDLYSDGDSVPSGVDDCPTETSILGDTESLPCSGRGLCSRETGECACFSGFSSSNAKGGPGNLNDCGYRVPKTTSRGE